MKVLIVDDEIKISNVIYKGLWQYGIEFMVVFDGEVVFELLLVEVFDFVIFDIIFFKVNGWEICKYICQELCFFVLILMFFVMGKIEYVIKGFDVGVDDFFVKLFKIEELVVWVCVFYCCNY